MDINESENAKVEETQEQHNEKDIRKVLGQIANRETLKFVGLIVVTVLVSIAGTIAVQKVAENFQSCDETDTSVEPAVEETPVVE